MTHLPVVVGCCSWCDTFHDSGAASRVPAPSRSARFDACDATKLRDPPIRRWKPTTWTNPRGSCAGAGWRAWQVECRPRWWREGRRTSGCRHWPHFACCSPDSRSPSCWPNWAASSAAACRPTGAASRPCQRKHFFYNLRFIETREYLNEWIS